MDSLKITGCNPLISNGNGLSTLGKHHSFALNAPFMIIYYYKLYKPYDSIIYNDLANLMQNISIRNPSINFQTLIKLDLLSFEAVGDNNLILQYQRN